MELLISILGIACLGAMLQDFPIYIWITEKLQLPDKPFRCTMCATFWYSVGILVALHGWSGITYAALAAITAEFIDRRLWN